MDGLIRSAGIGGIVMDRHAALELCRTTTLRGTGNEPGTSGGAVGTVPHSFWPPGASAPKTGADAQTQGRLEGKVEQNERRRTRCFSGALEAEVWAGPTIR